MALMNKSIHYAKEGKPLAIISATYVENLENYIFVEAFKDSDVKEAIEGLNFCFRTMDILPINEMTKIYEDQDQALKRPEIGDWVRIKSGLYMDDLGMVDRYNSDDQIYVKLIPRVDFNDKKQNKSNFFMRVQQQPFNPENIKDVNQRQSKYKPIGWNKTFYRVSNQLFRKGFIYKPFTLKQIDTSNAKPSQEERAQFLKLYNQNTIDGDSSDIEAADMRNLINQDSGGDVAVGDKIIITGGELQNVQGTILNFEDDGRIVNFKPLNIEGYTDTLSLDVSLVVKYFDIGENVMITEGKY